MNYRHLYLLLFLMLFSSKSYGQGWAGVWQWQNPVPTNERVMRFSFIDSLTGYSATHSGDFSVGTLSRTMDGGENWKRILVSADIKVVFDLDFVDTLNGFGVIGVSQMLARTRDGGRSWDWAGAATPDTTKFIAVEFRNKRQGLAVAFDRRYTSCLIYLTVDGGNSWTHVRTVPRNNSTGAIARDIEFVNDSVVFVVGSNGLITKSLNGGRTWNEPYLRDMNRPASYSIAFANDTLGFLRRDRAILRTTNAGQTWDSVSTDPFPGLPRTAMHFLDENRGWLVAGRLVAITTNSGFTWQIKGYPNDSTIPSTALPAVLGWRSWILGGTLGKIYKTIDQGATYTLPTKITSEHMYGLHFSGPQEGWVVGSNQTVLRTYNGGNTWQVVHSGNWPYSRLAHGFLDVFSFGDTAFAIGRDGLFKTMDGGSTWEMNPNVTGKDITFFGPRHGWIVQEAGGLLETTNGGATWARINTTAQMQRLYFVSDTRGFAAGSGANFGKAYFTTNAGRTWSAYGFAGAPAYAVHFADTLNGWVGGTVGSRNGDGILHRTSNGGRNWTTIRVIWQRPMHDLCFADALHGIAKSFNQTTGQETLISTQNGGMTWRDETGYGDLQQANAMAHVPGGRVWVVHDSGGIAKYEDTTRGYGANIISGAVYKRRNLNCTRGDNESGIFRQIVRLDPGARYTTTDSYGTYRMKTDSGQFQITVFPNDEEALLGGQACPDSGAGHSVNFPNRLGGIATGLNFAFNKNACPLLSVAVGSNRRRPCFPSVTTVWYRNGGSDTARNVVVHLQMPEYITVNSAQVPFSFDTASHSYVFQLGSVGPGGVNHFYVYDSVACDQSLANQIVCTKVWITPVSKTIRAGGCLIDPPGYDGSDITVKPFCISDTMVGFIIRNTGLGAMEGPRQYRVYHDTSLVSQSLFQLGGGDSTIILVPRSIAEAVANVEIRLEADQDSDHPFARIASGEDYCFRTRVNRNDDFSHDDESPVVDVDCQPMRGSFDPNDKLVSPKGVGQDGNILGETLLEYTIRFQNTGTDTAYSVVISDTLVDELDLSTLEMGASSHTFTYKVTGVGKPILTFSFPGIKLVDSVQNEAASHGYISFRLRPSKGLALGTAIRNEAAIYFDYNDPIRTNSTLNTIYEPIITTLQIRDLALQGAPMLSPAVLTGCDTSLSIPAFVVIKNQGNVDLAANDSVTIRLRDELTGLVRTYRQPLGAPLNRNGSLALAVPYSFTDRRDYRLWARVQLPGDQYSANDSTLIQLPYGALAVPRAFTFDSCALGNNGRPLVRGGAFEVQYGSMPQTGNWAVVPDPLGSGRQAYWDVTSNSVPAMGRIITLPVGPLGQRPALVVKWRAVVGPRFLSGDKVSFYTRTICGGRRLLKQLTYADSTLWPQGQYGVTTARMDTVAGLGPDSVAAIEVEFNIMPGSMRGPGSRTDVFVDDIQIKDSTFVITAQARALQAGSKLTAQPNPAKNTLTITSPRTGMVEVLTVHGQRLAAVWLHAGMATTIPLQGINPGVYVLRQEEMTLRVVKE